MLIFEVGDGVGVTDSLGMVSWIRTVLEDGAGESVIELDRVGICPVLRLAGVGEDGGFADESVDVVTGVSFTVCGKTFAFIPNSKLPFWL